MLKIKKIVAILVVAVTVISMSSISVFAQNNPDYTDFTLPIGMTEPIRYNSAGVPILGENYPAAKGRYSNYPNFNIYINNKIIPHANYPIGSVFSGSVAGAVECVGFAKYIYNYLWGDYGASPVSKNTGSSALAKQVLQSLLRGARITGFDSHGNQAHTMILVRGADTYVDVYHANYSDTVYNQVNVTKFTYSEFAGLFPTISAYVP